MSKKLSSTRILQDQVEAMVSLEGVVQLNDEWVADGFENLALRHGALGVLGVDNDRSLLENLHRIQSICGDVTDQVDLAIAKHKNQEKTCNNGFAISPCSFIFCISNDGGSMDYG